MSSVSFLAIKGKTTNINHQHKHEQITSARLVKPNCYYEIVEKVKNQRVFIDLDGSFEGSVEDFNTLNKKVETALLGYEPLVGVRTSSMYQAECYRWNDDLRKNELIEIVNKLSFIITYKRMTADVATMKNWIINDELPRLQALFQGIIPISTSKAVNQLNIDTGVYSHHKVRCPNAWKEAEQKCRISKVLKGTIDENLIQNTTDCEMIETIAQPVQQPKKSPTNNFPVNPAENVIVVNDFNEVLRALCDKIPHNKWYNTPDWININFIWKNEGWSYEVFDEFSKKYGGDKYHLENNKRIWSSIHKKSGLTQATLWEWLKRENKEEFNNLQGKRSDFYTLIQNNINNLDLAVLYYNIQPNKYAYSKVSKWWEYRPSNILVNTGDEKPTSLINNVGYTLRDYFNEQRKLLDPEDKDFKERNEAIMKIYSKLGVSSFCKGIMDFLPDLYYNEKIEELIDSNTNVIAFNNVLYDLTKNEVRPIRPDDYICRTTGYDLINKSDPKTKEELIEIFKGIFPDEPTREYYLKATALSFFTNRFENFYVLTGKGRNGKGVLDSLIKKALGKYHYTAEPTFLTTIIKAGVPNPTLAECNGVRYLSVSEPDNGAENCCLNVEFVKGLTGRDKITSRGLYEKNKTFENRFSVFLQCNNKPTLNKLDKAIVERLKCIPFTERFLSNPDPTDEHQHPCNDKLKDILAEHKYINEFMLYMFEIAYADKDIKGKDFKVSELCKESTNEYVEENNAFKFWFDSAYQKITLPPNFKKLKREEREKYIVRVRTSTLLAEYNETKPKNEQITAKKLRNALTFNDIDISSHNGISVISGYEKKLQEEDENPIEEGIEDY
jgi:phage/plasmid-associated DNA primase